MAKGYIYIMTNPALKDMVKIGFAKDVEERRKQLSTKALPFEYEVLAVRETSVGISDDELYEMIKQTRAECCLPNNKEFFAITAKEATNLLEDILELIETGKNGMPVNALTLLKRLIKISNMSQAAVARSCGRSPNDLWNMMNRRGQKSITVSNLAEILDVIGYKILVVSKERSNDDGYEIN